MANNAGRMLLAVAALLSMFQRLDLPPRVAHPGETVVVRARDALGQPVPGIQVKVRLPSGAIEPVGAADRNGEVRFVARAAGAHEFRADFVAGPAVIAVFDVVEEPRRWLYALFLTPLGLALVYWNGRQLRRESA